MAKKMAPRRLVLGALAWLVLAAGATAAARAAEIRVVSSGGFTAAYELLIAELERRTGQKLMNSSGSSMGNARTQFRSAGARRTLRRDDPGRPRARRLHPRGQGGGGSWVDLAESRIGFAVRAGAPKPDISTVDAMRRTLLDAPSIAYSASASGTYFSNEMVQRLGIAEQVLPKSRRILSVRVGSVLARGEAELGLQQISELLPIPGIDLLGPMPAELQRVTVFSAGIVTGAREPEAARELIRFLASPEVAETVKATGLDPMP